jgi:hypothetical protein
MAGARVNVSEHASKAEFWSFETHRVNQGVGVVNQGVGMVNQGIGVLRRGPHSWQTS